RRGGQNTYPGAAPSFRILSGTLPKNGADLPEGNGERSQGALRVDVGICQRRLFLAARGAGVFPAIPCAIAAWCCRSVGECTTRKVVPGECRGCITAGCRGTGDRDAQVARQGNRGGPSLQIANQGNGAECQAAKAASGKQALGKRARRVLAIFSHW